MRQRGSTYFELDMLAAVTLASPTRAPLRGRLVWGEEEFADSSEEGDFGGSFLLRAEVEVG